MKIKILNEYSYQTLPITEDMIEINDLNIDKIGNGYKFDLSTNSIVEDTTYQARKEQEEKLDRIAELKGKLAQTDYIDNKLIESLILNDTNKTEELKNEYASLLAQRQSWRDEINQLELEV